MQENRVASVPPTFTVSVEKTCYGSKLFSRLKLLLMAPAILVGNNYSYLTVNYIVSEGCVLIRRFHPSVGVLKTFWSLRNPFFSNKRMRNEHQCKQITFFKWCSL